MKLHGDLLAEMNNNMKKCEKLSHALDTKVEELISECCYSSQQNQAVVEPIPQSNNEKFLFYKDILKIYDALSDEESKSLFKVRLQTSLTKKNSLYYLYQELIKINRAGNLDDLISIIKSNMDFQKENIVLFWSNAKLSLLMYELFRDFNVKLSFICINENNTSEAEILGIPIISEDELVNINQDFQIVIGARTKKLKNIKNRLIAKGLKADNIKLRYTTWTPQYFENDLFTPSEHEVFVDGGAYDLETTQDFISWCGGKFDAIYAFEPDPKNYAKCMSIRNKNDELIRKCHIINAGLWSESTCLHFSNDANEKSKISQVGEMMIVATNIDTVLSGKPATFIKLDVEGSELEALKGAKDTITKHKPRIAVCIYHKDEDIIDIPLYILSLNPEYKFFIRHYSTWFSETVLYALPT